MSEDYTNLSLGDLRKKLRARFNQCRGAFAANVTKDTALQILEGSLDPDVAVANYHAGHAIAPTAIAPTAGKHEVKVDEADLKGELGKIIGAVRMLSEAAASEIERCIKDEADLRTELTHVKGELGKTRKLFVKFDPKVDGTGKEVEFAKGVKVPVVIDSASGDERLKWVPSVDPNFMPEAWVSRRDCGTVKMKNTVGDLIALLVADQRLMLVGPPSVGKTAIITQIGAASAWPVVRVNGNRDFTMHDFVGHYEARDGSTIWVDGPLVTAMKIGAILMLDEVDHLPGECSSILHSVLEPKGKLLITANGGEVVEPHENFRIVASANTAGFGDETGLHPNAQVQDAAFLSRFDAVFRVDWLPQTAETALVQKTSGIDTEKAELIVKVANDTRAAVAKGTLTYPITTRQTVAWGRQVALLKGSLPVGFAIAVLNKMPDTDVTAIAEIAERHLGNLNAKR